MPASLGLPLLAGSLRYCVLSRQILKGETLRSDQKAPLQIIAKRLFLGPLRWSVKVLDPLRQNTKSAIIVVLYSIPTSTYGNVLPHSVCSGPHLQRRTDYPRTGMSILLFTIGCLLVEAYCLTIIIRSILDGSFPFLRS